MRDRYRLGWLKNEELLGALSALVERQNTLTADLLAHLAEVDERRLHLELGFPSLFAYCVDSLGFSESAAGRRVAVARVCRRFPVAFELLARGELHLSALDALGAHLNDENAAELFALCARKARRRIDELLAARFPKPDVRDQIRRLPTAPASPSAGTVEPRIGAEIRGDGATVGADPALDRDGVSGTEGAQPQSALGAQPRPAEVRSAEVRSAEVRPAEARSAEARSIEPLSAGRYGVRFTAGTELREKIEQARALASHRLPNSELAALFELALDALIRDLRKQRFALDRKPRATAQSQRHPVGDDAAEPASARAMRPLPPGGSDGEGRSARAHGLKRRRSRHIPAATSREVYARDAGQCTFVSQQGRRCAARGFLELDHEDPWAEGGESTAKNLRLRCRAHNQHQARAHFGAARVEAGIARSRGEREGKTRPP